MKTTTLSLLFVSLFFVAALTAQNPELKFTIVNKSGIDLYQVFLSESLNDKWGKDIIPGDFFANASSVNVAIPVDNNTLCMYDIKLTDEYGEGVIFTKIDLWRI